MMNRTLLCVLTVAASLLAQPVTTLADAADDTYQSALYLLEQSVQVNRDGRHNLMLAALRHMHDPAMKPLFTRLADSSSPSLQINGFLGLAETAPQRQLDLNRLASVKDVRLQSELISASLDLNLLTTQECAQIAGWTDIDPAVRLIVATELVQKKQFTDLDLLRKLQTNDNLARRAVASMLLRQLAQPEGDKGLADLSASTDATRDEVRSMLLQTALRFEFDQMGPWALGVSKEPGAGLKLGLLAMRVAMRFNTPGSGDVWQQHWKTASDATERLRLALVALNVSPWWNNAPLFAVIKSDEDASVKQIGEAAIAIAGKTDVGAALASLVRLGNPIAVTWALGYAKAHASPDDARAALSAAIDAANRPGLPDAQRLDDAVTASQMLFDRDPAMAKAVLQPVLGSPKTDPLVQQAILFGLIRSKGDQAHAVVDGLPPFSQPKVRAMALLLRARNGQSLAPDELASLGLMVRGGGNLPDQIRLQAAWAYLKKTGQAEKALAQVLD